MPIISNFPRGGRRKPEFSVPLKISADAGSEITAIHSGGTTLTGFTDSDGNLVFHLNIGGEWTLFATDGVQYTGPTKIEIPSCYEQALIYREPELPEGYTKLTYFSNPHKTSASSISGFLFNMTAENILSKRIEFKVDITDRISRNATSYLYGTSYSFQDSASGLAQTYDDYIAVYTSTKLATPEIRVYSQGAQENIQLNEGETLLDVTIDHPKRLVQVNDHVLNYSDSTPNTTYAGSAMAPVLLAYARRFYREGGSDITRDAASGTECKFYGCKMFSSTAAKVISLVQNWIPCINPSGIVGAYDVVGEAFASAVNADSPFEAGVTA